MFKEVLVLYNVTAGKGKAEVFAKKIKKILREKGDCNVALFKSKTIADTENYFKTLERTFDVVIIIGGDGTLGSTINAMVKAGKIMPIYAFGHGTANDFPTYFKTMTSLKKFEKVFLNPDVKLEEINLIDVDGNYAINVVGGGAFTNGVKKLKPKLKKMFGKVAYYADAIKTAFKMKPQSLTFKIDGKTIKEDCYLFLICNTRYAGGLKCVANEATHNDDILDLVAFKKCNVFKQLGILFSVWRHKTSKNKNVLYVKGKEFSVSLNTEPNPNFTKTDFDGNAGGDYPLNAKIADIKIKVVSNQ